MNTRLKSKIGPTPSSSALALPPTPTLPRIFSAQSLARYLGVPKKTVLKMKFPKVIVGPKTHLYLCEDVLAHLDQLKKGGAA